MWFSQIAAKLKLLMQNLEKKSGNWNRMFQIYNKTSFIIAMLAKRQRKNAKFNGFTNLSYKTLQHSLQGDMLHRT